MLRGLGSGGYLRHGAERGRGEIPSGAGLEVIIIIIVIIIVYYATKAAKIHSYTYKNTIKNKKY